MPAPEAWEVASRWYSEQDPHSALWSTVQRVRQRSAWRAAADEMSLKLFSDMRYVGYRSVHAAPPDEVLDARMGDNVIRAIVRTLHAKVVKRRPVPSVVTDEASWALTRRARLLERWLQARFRDVNADDVFSQAVYMALILGTGVVRSYGDPDRGAMLECVPTFEVLVDDSEARYGAPRNVYLVRAVDRGVLRHKYPDVADEVIRKAGSAASQQGFADALSTWGSGPEDDLVTVVEAIHLPSSKAAKDGRWTVATDSGVLHDEEWARDRFPLAFIRGERRPVGLWGIGVPEDLASAQLEIQRTTQARSTIIRLLSVPVWLIEKGSRVMRSKLLPNVIGRAVEYVRTPPQLLAPVAVPPDLWQHAAALKAAMFEARGVSQLSAAMLKPAGLNSGKALRIYGEMEAELLIDLIQAHERLIQDCAELLIEEQRELGEEHAHQAVTHIGPGGMQEIRWSEADMQAGKYQVRVEPVSKLSTSVAGRIEDVYDLRDLGAVTDPEEIRELLDLKDLGRQRRRAMSHRELIYKVLEWQVLEKGRAVQPEPTWDLQLAVEIGLQLITQTELYEDAPQDRLELLREFVEACRLILAPPAGPQDTSQDTSQDGSEDVLPGAPGSAGEPLVAPPEPAELPPAPTGVA